MLDQAGIINFHECEEYAEAECYYKLKNSDVRIDRYIRINFPDEIIIHDITRGKNIGKVDNGSIVRQQFIFSPELSKDDSQGEYTILEGKQ